MDAAVTQTARLERSPLALLAQAAGNPWRWPGKCWRFCRAIWGYIDTREARRKLTRLQGLGLIEHVPTRGQLIVGSADMLRFWISPAAADYYKSYRAPGPTGSAPAHHRWRSRFRRTPAHERYAGRAHARWAVQALAVHGLRASRLRRARAATVLCGTGSTHCRTRLRLGLSASM